MPLNFAAISAIFTDFVFLVDQSPAMLINTNGVNNSIKISIKRYEHNLIMILIMVTSFKLREQIILFPLKIIFIFREKTLYPDLSEDTSSGH